MSDTSPRGVSRAAPAERCDSNAAMDGAGAVRASESLNAATMERRVSPHPQLPTPDSPFTFIETYSFTLGVVGLRQQTQAHAPLHRNLEDVSLSVNNDAWPIKSALPPSVSPCVCKAISKNP